MKEGKTVQNEKDIVLNMLAESREHVEWKGDRFKPKTMKLNRLNTGKITNRADFREVSTFVTYSEVSLSMNVVIDESFTITENQLTPITTRVNTGFKIFKNQLNCLHTDYVDVNRVNFFLDNGSRSSI